MARLSKETWEEIRQTWELDSREGFDWVANYMDNIVSRQGIGKKAKKEAWAKRGVVTDKRREEKLEKRVAEVSEIVKVAQPPKVSTVAQPKEEVSNKRGQPTKYREAFNNIAYELCMLGADDNLLSDAFEVDISTIHNWKKTHPDFFSVIRRGKYFADGKVAVALYKSAVGEHFVTEERIVQNELGHDIVEIKKQVAPNTNAQRYWLNNRQRDKWRDRVELDATIDVEETSMDYLQNFIDVMAKARERDDKMREERMGLIEGDYSKVKE